MFRVTHRAAVLAALVAVALLPAPAPAQGLAQEGMLVVVPNPITSEAFTRIKNQIEAGRKSPSRPVTRVVLDFNNGKPANTPNYGVAYELADYIAGLTELTTIAYVNQPTTGHTVLPVLACKEIVMARGASLGEVAAAGEPVSGPTKAAYNDILSRTGRDPQRALVQKMIDRAVSLGLGSKPGLPKFYVDLRYIKEVEKLGVKVTDPTPLPFGGPGAEGKFSAEQLRDTGLVNSLQDTRKDLAEAYGLSAASLKDDPLGGKPPVAYRYALRGPIDGGVREAVKRTLDDVARRGGNLVFLEIECSGGDFAAATDIAHYLIDRQQGENPLLVVGFVPAAAPDTAAVIALGCGELVMSRRKDGKDGAGDQPEATLGDFDALVGRDPARADVFKQALRGLAEKQGFSPLLTDGMLDRSIGIVQVRAANDATKRRLMSEAQLEAEKGQWVREKTIKPVGQLLVLNATLAAEVGLARYTVDGRDLGEVFALYGVDPTKVREATPGWLDRFADYLRKPAVTVLLVAIGFVGLILELKVPGTTVPGIVAALCFILVFWAHSQFNGQAAVLGGLIFALGLVLILLEMFVIPGFGVTGLLGILFLLGGVGLATLDRFPESGEEWTTFGFKVGQYVAALAAAVAVAFLIARFLPNIPYANKMMLVPPTELDEPPAADLPGAAAAAGLLGAVGLSATPLRPAGMAAFGDQYVDVVTEGGFIPSGTRVQVVEVEGTRIVVKEV